MQANHSWRSPVRSRGSLTVLLASLLLALVPAVTAASETPIGQVDLLRGSASALDKSGRIRPLQLKGVVLAGDQISTDKRSVAAIKLNDGAKFLVGAESKLVLDEFVYGKSEQEDKLLARVVTGAFRFVSGLVAKKRPASMSVRLGAVATVGVRGTTVGGEVVGESATVVLLDPEDGQANTAIDVFNDFGQVSINEPGYGTRVPDARSGPTPPERMRLRAIENLMRNLQSVTRASTRMRLP
jgi:hypothetical protein